MNDVNETAPSAAIVLEAVSAGDRRRRMRAVWRTLARLLPAAGALVCVVGLAGALLHGSWLITASVWVVLAASIAGWVYASTRPRVVTDVEAAVVDRDAMLGGEIRSAAWFATRPSRGAWETFHIDKAAERIRTVDWRVVYPPVRTRGAWIAAALLSAAAFALPAGLPTGSGTSAAVPSTAEVLADLVEVEGLSPELTERLMELLAAIRAGTMTPLEAMASLQTLTDFLKADAALRQQIAELLDDAVNERDRFERTNAPTTADSGAMTDDVEWARENLASRLAAEAAQRAAEDADGGENPPSESQEEGPTTEQSADGQTGEASEGQAGARVPAKRSDAADGAAAMMLGNTSSSIGEPGSVFGGKRGNVRYGSSQAAEIAASLKREMVEAVVNVDRSDLEDDEDRRRKTQQSWSALTYTRSESRASFDRARAGAVRGVPEARRLVVERYFIRPPADEEPTGR